MRRRHSLLAATTTALLLIGDAASAQAVHIFDEAPPLEQLRSIMIPESHGGQSRSIVFAKPDAPGLASPVQRAASAVIEPETRNAPPATVAAAAMPAPPRPAPVSHAPEQRRDQSVEAGIVGFRINFAFDSAALPSSAAGFVDRIAELMKDEPQLRLRVEGHTDARGTPGYNLDLSKRRALAVAEYLVAHHAISPERLVLDGRGMSEPLAEDGYDARNRRVQFVRLS
jgi:outer membrane protein OmpA-like peptidoglycan-associated protein